MEHPERRLAAVLAADVVGYSRLIEVDEAGTLARLKSVRLELIDPAIDKCRGRIIKTSGDGILVEFQSVTEALRCAVDFQERMARPRTVYWPILCRSDCFVQPADVARPRAARFFGSGNGAARGPCRGRRSCRRGAAKTAKLHRPGSSENAALSADFRQ
jgi:hypothetical protein